MLQSLVNYLVIGVIAIVAAPLSVLIHDQTMILISKLKTMGIKNLEDAIKNETIRKFVTACILKAESLIGTSDGTDKFKMVKEMVLAWVRKVNPALIPIVEPLIQGTFDGLKEEGQI